MRGSPRSRISADGVGGVSTTSGRLVAAGLLSAAALLAACTVGLSADVVLVEAEGFSNRGGWVVDQQFMDQMGSPYLLAHGLGVPVADATTTAAFPRTGSYRVFVRTKDWPARWKARGSPGRFQLKVDGKTLGTQFGTKGEGWFWHDGGQGHQRYARRLGDGPGDAHDGNDGGGRGPGRLPVQKARHGAPAGLPAPPERAQGAAVGASEIRRETAAPMSAG